MQPQATEEEGAGGPSQSQPTVLIVEDDHLVAIANEDALLDAGFKVVGIAATASEAIDLAKAHAPDLVIMDVTLRGQRDGVDAALELFRDLGLRCVFATAYHDDATRARAEPAKPLAWLAKPFHPESLVRAVRKAVLDRGQS